MLRGRRLVTCQGRAKELQGEVGRLADLLTASECEALQTASELRDLKVRLSKQQHSSYKGKPWIYTIIV